MHPLRKLRHPAGPQTAHPPARNLVQHSLVHNVVVQRTDGGPFLAENHDFALGL
jgi:hypothetical protein